METRGKTEKINRESGGRSILTIRDVYAGPEEECSPKLRFYSDCEELERSRVRLTRIIHLDNMGVVPALMSRYEAGELTMRLVIRWCRAAKPFRVQGLGTSLISASNETTSSASQAWRSTDMNASSSIISSSGSCPT